METDVFVWSYTLLVAYVRKEEEEKSLTQTTSLLEMHVSSEWTSAMAVTLQSLPVRFRR